MASIMDNDDAVCIVGLGCRYPGDKGGVEAFWETITKARSTHSEVPKERWDPDVYYHPNHERAGSINTRGGYFLDDVSRFDAPFFSITANEAGGMDPQQRLLLELAYETFENAGINIGQLKGSKTGCYVGSFSTDYSDDTQRDLNELHPYSSTGCGKSMLSNRVSWFYDLRGPSFTIDTACSSSMYAFHLACQSIRLGETDMGLVGGSNVILAPAVMRSLTNMRFLSPTGKCHSYDQAADGYARGEGVGMILLKRLSKAIADGDTIRAIVRTSGVNQDGKTPGITMPSASAQAALIRQCYQEAGLTMDETAYFEGHGTGTLLGDPIELQALGATFGATRTMENALYVGSVKANVGHQEGGAGVAGVIRATLAVEKGIIPPNAELEKPNAAFKLEEWKIALPTEPLPWPTNGVRRVSINSFGYGGANSHAIIDDAYSYMSQRGLKGNHSTDVTTVQVYESDSDSGFGSEPVTPDLTESAPETVGARKCLFPFSAFDQSALGRMLPRYIDFLQERLERCQQTGLDLTDMMSDMSFTLATRRTVFDHRAAYAAGSVNELVEQIQASPAPKTRKVPRNENIAFIFTGQGAQYCAMGKELLAYDVFRTSLERSRTILNSLGCEWDLIEELLKDETETQINLPRLSQPLCTAIQIAQVELLASWGVYPKATVGHSSGEIGAAFSAGKISHDDAMGIAYHRGLFSDRVNARQAPKRGAMLAVGLGPAEVEPYVTQMNSGNPEMPAIVVACINSPQSVTISGDNEAVKSLEAQLKEADVFARGLKTSDTAYHSPHMRLIADDYLDSMKNVAPLKSDKPDVRMFSSVTGNLVENAADLGASYWVANMLQPVRFSDALHSMLNYSANPRKRRRPGAEFTAFVELGPSAALKGPIQQTLAQEDTKIVANIVYTSVLQRGQEADTCALNAAAKLWAQGVSIDFAAINQHLHVKHMPKVQSDLPAYAWNHSSRMWHDTTANALWMKEPRTDLLGCSYGLRNMNAPIWRNMIRMSETPWLADHKIFTQTIYPGTSMIVMALEAAQKQVEPGRVAKGFQFRDISLPKALPIPADGGKVEVQMYIKPNRLGSRTQNSTWFEFSFVSLDDQKQWVEHSFGQFKIVYDTEASEVDGGLQATVDWTKRKAEYAETKERMYQEIPKRSFYKALQGIGMNYGPTFQGVETIFVGDRGDCHTAVAIPDTASVMPHKFEHPHLIHPATLDAITQTLFGTMIKSGSLKTSGAQVPVNIGKLYIAANLPSGAGTKFVGYTSSLKKNSREMIGQIIMSDEEWSEPKVVYEDFVTTGLNQVMAGQSQGALARRKCATVQWVQDLRYSGPVMSSPDSLDTESIKAVGAGWSFEVVDLMLRTLDELRDQRFPTEHLEQFFRWAESACANLELPEQPSDLDIVEALDEFPERLGALVSSGKDISEALTEDFFAAFDVSTAELVTPTDYAALDAWLELIYLNNPNASVLLLGDGSSTSAACHVAKTHITRLGHADCLHNCTFAEVDEPFVQRTKSALDTHKVQLQYTTFDPSQSSALGAGEAQSFDLVVAPPNVAFSEHALSNIKSVMSANGILLLSGSQQLVTPANFISALSETWWNANMRSLVKSKIIESHLDWTSQLAAMNAKVYADVRGGFITVGAVPQESTDFFLSKHLSGRHVVLLQSESAPTEPAARFQELIIELLQQADCTVAVTSLQDQEAIKDQLVICLAELSEDLIANMDEISFVALKDTVASAAQLVWLTRGGVHLEGEDSALNLNQTLATGLLRSIRSEVARTTNIHLDVSSSTDLTTRQTAQSVLHVIANELFATQVEGSTKVADHDRELALHISKVFVPRVTWDDSFNQELAIPHRQDVATLEPLYQEERSLQLVVGTTGRLDSLHWVDDVHNPALRKKGLPNGKAAWVEVRVRAVGLNFMDIMAAMGQIPTSSLGLEIAGEIIAVGPDCKWAKPGMRVVLPRKPSFLTTLYAWEEVCEEMPADMDFATAASIPVVYMTAYVGLMMQGRLSKGETILIHAAAGGVGQAVLQMAQWIGAEIYVTVGSNAKKQLLVDHYGIPEERIFSSRDLTFAAGIMRATNGKGVDVVVNSLAGEALRETWNCIAFGGRFIEVGKRDMLGNTGLDMAPFLRQVTFTSVNLEAFEELDFPGFRDMWHEVWALITKGVIGAVHPINRYNLSDTEKAFRFMASGAHLGKVVVTAEKIAKAIEAGGEVTSLEETSASADDEILVPVMPPNPQEVELDPTATYVLCGGLGGIGRSTALMMADHGAKHLVFLSRSGATKTEHHNLLKDLDAAGVRADALVCDATDADAVARFTELCKQNKWKVKGVVQCAMVLRDRMFENMSHEDWTEATKAKVQGTKHLSDFLPADMDFFIMLSSLSGVIGNPGQANYSAANTYMDALAQWRRSQGMAAIAIDLGVVAEVGYLAENPEGLDAYASMAPLHITDSDLLMLLSAAMKGCTADGRPMPAQVIAGFGKEFLAAGAWANDKKFSHALTSNDSLENTDADSSALREAVASSPSIRDAGREVQDAILTRLGRALMLEPSDIDASKPLHAYGVDSLVAVELRNWVFRELAADVTVFDIMSPMSIQLLSLKIASISGLLPKAVIAEQIDEVTKELAAAVPAQ